MKQNLNGEWTLYCIKEKGGKNPPFGVYPALSDAAFSQPAQVPGEVQLDLLAAGREPDPFFGDNYYSYIKYESCGWVYTRTFSCVLPENENEILLRFDGIDTVADIFLNGRLLGHTENMLTEHSFSVRPFLKDGENELTVHIFSALNYIRGKDYPVLLHGGGDRMQLPCLRKAAHSVGWDIFPRMMTAGLWRDVTLEEIPETRITETYFIVSEANEKTARLRWAVRFRTDLDDLDNIVLKIRAVCGDHSFGFETRPLFTAANGTYTVQAPKLWWPHGYGEQNLYTITTGLYRNDTLLAEKTERIGLRSVKLERDFTPGQMRFQFIVNGVPVFLRGSNHVPTDVFHSRAKGRIEKTAALLREIGCNVIRSWGGGIYEDTLFYDRCDENGILIWQDFAFGNAVYPQDGSLDANITQEIANLLRRIRNHPSVLIYAADNEIDMRYANLGFPDERKVYSRIAQELLPNLIAQHDPYREYLKSSPEVPFGRTIHNVPEQHTWGARAWYKDDFYKHASAAFIGEAGYHGCPAPESLRKFIPEEDLWPVFNRSYAAHSTEDLRSCEGLDRIRMMTRQARLLCGEDPTNLEDLALVSQFAQGEAIKYFIERTLALRPRRSGIIWWNLADGWPQISDAIVDYYYNKKPGFDFIRRAQEPVTVLIGDFSGWDAPVIAANCTREDAEVIYTVTDADSGEILREGHLSARANENTAVCGIDVPISDKRLLLIDYTVNGKKQWNHFITGMPPYNIETLRRWKTILETKE